MQIRQSVVSQSSIVTNGKSHTPLQTLVALSAQYQGLIPSTIPVHYVTWALKMHRSNRIKSVSTPFNAHVIPSNIIRLGMT